MRADEKSHHGDALDDAFAVVAEVLLGKDRKKRVVVTPGLPRRSSLMAPRPVCKTLRARVTQLSHSVLR